MSKKQRKLAGSDNSNSWHAILRIPSLKKEKFDDLIANQDFSKNDVWPIKLKFEENGRRGQIKIGDEFFGFAVKEFPCIIEVSRVKSCKFILVISFLFLFVNNWERMFFVWRDYFDDMLFRFVRFLTIPML